MTALWCIIIATMIVALSAAIFHANADQELERVTQDELDQAHQDALILDHWRGRGRIIRPRGMDMSDAC
jgi:hypothetical protein